MRERAGIGDSVSELAAEAAETLRGAKQRVSEAYGKTSEAATQWAQDAVEYRRNNPFVTSLLAFGAGVGVGCWLGSERRPRHSKRLGPRRGPRDPRSDRRPSLAPNVREAKVETTMDTRC